MAKKLSLASKCLALLFIVASYIVSAVCAKKIPSADEVLGMIQVSLFIATVFVPVDLSLIVQNIKGVRNG